MPHINSADIYHLVSGRFDMVITIPTLVRSLVSGRFDIVITIPTQDRPSVGGGFDIVITIPALVRHLVDNSTASNITVFPI